MRAGGSWVCVGGSWMCQGGHRCVGGVMGVCGGEGGVMGGWTVGAVMRGRAWERQGKQQRPAVRRLPAECTC